ncbi:MAG: cell division protein ZipA [Gammaproteobacteria bacterium]
MDRLRWILLLIGVVIIGAIYVYGRLRERGARRRLWEEEDPGAGIVLDRDPSASPAEPDAVDSELQELGSRMSVADEAPVPWLHEPVKVSRAEAAPERQRRAPAADGSGSASRAAQAPSAAAPPPEPEKIVVVYVTAPVGMRFAGPALMDALAAANLHFGDMNIFHRYVDTPQGSEAVFSAANLVEPGWFDLEKMETFESPGLTLFLRLPGPVEPVRAFDALVACAEQLRQALNGELRDGTRSVLSKQTIGHLREEVQEFSRKAGVAGSRAR